MLGQSLLLMAAVVAGPSGYSADPSKPAAEKVICKKEPVVGTRLKFTKTCLTQAQWQARREAIARGLREFGQGGGGIRCGKNSGQPC